VLREANHFSRALNDDYNFNQLLTLLARQWYPRASGIIAVSEGVRNDLISTLRIPFEKVTTIHNPVDLDRIRRLASERLPDDMGLNEGCPFILAAGRLEPQKDYKTLLMAYAARAFSDHSGS
jgi:glycosyltransferase involved in cell wall biosynthesis